MNLLDVASITLALLAAIAYLTHLLWPRKNHSGGCLCASSGCKVPKPKIGRRP